MRVVREQMLCLISPNWGCGIEPLIDGNTQQKLNALLDDIDIVHFASFVLLPPLPDARDRVLPALMFELAVDEGVTPEDLLIRLTNHPSDVLWRIYACNLELDLTVNQADKNEFLLKHFRQCLSVADGAFLGPRDRSVSQVKYERKLYVAAKKYAQTIKPQDKQDTSVFALKMAQWAERNPRFEWARDPSPRSYWRSQSAFGKLSYILSIPIVLTFFLNLAFKALRWLKLEVFDMVNWIMGCLQIDATIPLSRAIDALLEWCITKSAALLYGELRLVGVLLFLLLVFSFFFLFLPALIEPWRQWLKALGREMDRPSETRASRVTYVFAWFFLIALGFLIYLSLMYVVGDFSYLGQLKHWLMTGTPNWLKWLLALYFVAYAALAIALMVGLHGLRHSVNQNGVLARKLRSFRRWLHEPFEDESPRAQQVHPSIEKAEADLVAHTAHMVSLCEVRTPYWWNGFMMKASLRFVTFFGYAHFTEGSLGGARGIQYSHWHIIDGGRRLLFCGNFDGTFGGYLDDFIKGPSGGTTMFWRWSNLRKRQSAVVGHPDVKHDRDFPPTRLLFFRGVKCELKFKAYARDSMLPHLFRYDANDLSSEQKARATALRDALFGERTLAKDDVIMRVLET
jgi:hypothetical protein